MESSSSSLSFGYIFALASSLQPTGSACMCAATICYYDDDDNDCCYLLCATGCQLVMGTMKKKWSTLFDCAMTAFQATLRSYALMLYLSTGFSPKHNLLHLTPANDCRSSIVRAAVNFIQLNINKIQRTGTERRLVTN